MSKYLKPQDHDGVLYPADHSFAAVNDFVHNVEVGFDDLQGVLLGLANEHDKWRALLLEAAQSLESGLEDGGDLEAEWSIMDRQLIIRIKEAMESP
jgi:hypothetical protein